MTVAHETTTSSPTRGAAGRRSAAGGRPRLRLLAVAAAAMLAGPTAAVAAPAWVPPTTLSGAGTNSSSPTIAVDPFGNLTAAWSELADFELHAQLATRPLGGPWDAPAHRFDAGPSTSGTPQIAMDAAGRATAVWVQGNDPQRTLRAMTRPLGGAWSAPSTIAGPASIIQPAVAVDAAGDTVVVWTSAAPGGTGAIKSARRLAGGAWESPVTLGAGALGGHEANIAMNAAGKAAVVWTGVDPADGIDKVRVTTRTLAGGWEPATNISDAGTPALEPVVVVDGQGNVTAAWTRVKSLTPPVVITVNTSTRVSGGTWSKPALVSAGAGPSSTPRMVADGMGNLTAVWYASVGGHVRLMSATSQVGGDWGAPAAVSVSATQDDLEPRLTVDDTGNATLVWLRGTGSSSAVLAARKPPKDWWGAPHQLAPSGAAPAVAVDAASDVVATWAVPVSPDVNRIEVAAFDSSAPVLRNIAVPEHASVGDQVALSVSPVDAWSTIGSVDWDLGDGRTLSGSSVGARYGRAGTFTVTVRATDSLGNSSSATRTITVSDPPPTPTPAPTVTPTVAPSDAPAPAPRVVETEPLKTTSPVAELTRTGRTVAIAVIVRRKPRSSTCGTTATATAIVAGKRSKARLIVSTETVGSTTRCRATGKLVLAADPVAGHAVKITIAGRRLVSRNLKVS